MPGDRWSEHKIACGGFSFSISVLFFQISLFWWASQLLWAVLAGYSSRSSLPGLLIYERSVPSYTEEIVYRAERFGNKRKLMPWCRVVALPVSVAFHFPSVEMSTVWWASVIYDDIASYLEIWISWNKANEHLDAFPKLDAESRKQANIINPNWLADG